MADRQCWLMAGMVVVVGKLDHDFGSFGHNGLSSEPGQDLPVFLAGVEFVLGGEDFKVEGGDGPSELARGSCW